MGSYWLTTQEYVLGNAVSGLRDALLTATSSDTVRSRIYSGKPARLLKNDWTKAWEEPGAPEPLPMPPPTTPGPVSSSPPPPALPFRSPTPPSISSSPSK